MILGTGLEKSVFWVLLPGVEHIENIDSVANLIDHDVVGRDYQFPSALFTTSPACEWEGWEAVHRSLYC